VKPSRVYLFAVDPGVDALRPFVKRLLGLVRHALGAYDGLLHWETLAAAMAHRVRTVQAGVRWLAARGWVTLLREEDEAVIVREGGVGDKDAEQIAQRDLEELLHETAAYRAHFQQADAGRLVDG